MKGGERTMFGKIMGIVCGAISAAEVAVGLTLVNKAKKVIDANYKEVTEIEAETEE